MRLAPEARSSPIRRSSRPGSSNYWSPESGRKRQSNLGTESWLTARTHVRMHFGQVKRPGSFRPGSFRKFGRHPDKRIGPGIRRQGDPTGVRDPETFRPCSSLRPGDKKGRDRTSFAGCDRMNGFDASPSSVLLGFPGTRNIRKPSGASEIPPVDTEIYICSAPGTESVT